MTSPHFPDDLRTDAPLGCVVGGGTTAFRLFAPRATAVTLVLFERFDDERGRSVPMTPAGGGAWEHVERGGLTGQWYGYRVDGPEGPGEMFDPSVLVADPYSRAVTTVNHWRLPAKTLIVDPAYDWEGVEGPALPDHSALAIYECHVRDMTAHPSAGARHPGSYAGFAERGIRGGLEQIRSLGVNAVEFLPLMKFGTIELPFRDPAARSDQGRINDWNPYARNHWGYMTSFFFAPETWYATGATLEPGAVNGPDDRACREFKDLVKALHREGIAVILDVVYNHTSHYDFQPFKYIDKRYYYRCDDEGNFLEESGCGNDFDTGRPMTRRLIADSVRFWLEEYRVDGFRFDLAGMIAEETCDEITRVARSVKPDVALIAEPWGGGRHHPEWFTRLGWHSWNDRFRDAVKGRSHGGPGGFLGGEPGSAARVAGILTGSPAGEDRPAPDPRLSVNYLEAHDGYTLADFLRTAMSPGETGDADVDVSRLLRLAALALCSSPGPIMLHEGQEFARRKIIERTGVPDPDAGKPDHNSYNKDNATNWLDFDAADRGKELTGYYRDLLELRERHPLLCRPAAPGEYTAGGEDGLLLIRRIPAARRMGRRPTKGAGNRYLVLLNGSRRSAAAVELTDGPAGGRWRTLADGDGVHPKGRAPKKGTGIVVPPLSGMILMEGE